MQDDGQRGHGDVAELPKISGKRKPDGGNEATSVISSASSSGSSMVTSRMLRLAHQLDALRLARYAQSEDPKVEATNAADSPAMHSTTSGSDHAEGGKRDVALLLRNSRLRRMNASNPIGKTISSTPSVASTVASPMASPPKHSTDPAVPEFVPGPPFYGLYFGYVLVM